MILLVIELLQEIILMNMKDLPDSCLGHLSATASRRKDNQQAIREVNSILIQILLPPDNQLLDQHLRPHQHLKTMKKILM